MDGIIKKYVQDANLLSGVDIKKINDSLAKNHHFQIDSLGKLISILNKDKINLSERVSSLKENITSLTASIPEPSEELEMDKLVMNLIPMIKEKAKQEEIEEQRDKKLKIVRSLINQPEGIVDTLNVNDSISKKFTLRLRKKEVVGFYPYWRTTLNYRNYNFGILSSLIYYGYELNPETGLCQDIHDWDKQKVTDFAKTENCRVYLGVFCTAEKGINELLKNNKAQQAFINSIIIQLKVKSANGVNLNFGSPGGGNRLNLLRFIKLLHRELTAANTTYKITLTIPVIDKNFFYDLGVLESMVEYFIIDFTKKNVKGPIVSLSGNDYSLKSGISRYLGSNVPPEKFIACFPYRGVVWDAETNHAFLNYIPYSEIAESYTNDYGYKYDNGTERTDVVFNKIDTNQQVWFDDARTLGEKYNYVLDENLSGVGIWTLGDDEFKPELWNVLLDKMIIIDTTEVQEIKNVKPITPGKTFWDKIEKEFGLYQSLFQHPCDSQVFDTMILDDYIGYITLFALVLLIITGAYTVIKKRSLGDDWPYRKCFLTLLIIFTIINMITILMFCFLSKNFIGFGKNASNDCEVSFMILLKLLGVGFLLGGISTRILVLPLIKRKEIP